MNLVSDQKLLQQMLLEQKLLKQMLEQNFFLQMSLEQILLEKNVSGEYLYKKCC